MNYKEYLICKKRGHSSSGIGMSIGNITTTKCKYCGTDYYFEEPKMIEKNIPDENYNDSTFTGISN